MRFLTRTDPLPWGSGGVARWGGSGNAPCLPFGGPRTAAEGTRPAGTNQAGSPAPRTRGEPRVTTLLAILGQDASRV
jgi:hypothetical protein